RLFAAGARADFQKDIAFVVRILRQQHRLQFAADPLEPRLSAGALFVGQPLHFRIAADCRRGREVGLRLREFATAPYDRISSDSHDEESGSMYTRCSDAINSARSAAPAALSAASGA